MLSAVFLFLTGIGLLLFGVQYMGQALEKLLGANFRKKINKYAGNRFSSFGFGALITFVLQSSTASTAMFVGFAGAGIITLYQGINLIIGCNVGTSISAFLLAFESFNVVEIIASFVLIGVVINLFSKSNQTLKNVGNMLIGFGILFAGLVMISSGTAYFKSLEGFDSFILSFTNPFLLIVVGLLITALLQSSFGAFAIIISLMATGLNAGFDAVSACYLIYGVNIGTCLTTLVAGISTNTDGKRVAWFHLIFNLFGTIIFTLLTLFVPWTSFLNTVNPTLQVLIINLIFNLVTACITLAFAKTCTKFTKLLVRRSKKEIESAYTIRSGELKTPTIAIKKLNFGVITLFETYNVCFDKLQTYLLNSDVKNPKALRQSLSEFDKNCTAVYSNTIKISSQSLNKDQKNIIFVQHIVNNFKDITANFLKIIDQNIVDGKRIVTKVRQKNTVKQITDKIEDINKLLTEIMENFYNENFNFKCFEFVDQILDIEEEISALKNNDKRITSLSVSQKTGESAENNFFNIINEFSALKNSLVDISVSSLEFFNKETEYVSQEKVQTVEEMKNEKNAWWF